MEFTLRLKTLHHKEDVDKLESIVKRVGGIWEGAYPVKFLNYWNECTGTQFACLYHLDRDIEMEVLT